MQDLQAGAAQHQCPHPPGHHQLPPRQWQEAVTGAWQGQVIQLLSAHIPPQKAPYGHKL